MLNFISFLFHLVCCFEMLVYLGVAIVTIKKVDKSLQFLSGKYLAEYCLLTLSSNNNDLISL